MKLVTSVDKKGYKIVTKLRDEDNINNPGIGIPISIDIRELDWDNIKKELNNRLVDDGLITWDDVMKSQNGVTIAINSVIRPLIISLYKESYRAKKEIT